MGKTINLLGKKYTRLTVMSFIGTRNKKRYWLCRCECGKTIEVISASLIAKYTQSCGCIRIETLKKAFVKHGEANKTKEYYAWKGINARCNNPKTPQYKDYGCRGIKVCDRWLNSYENFLADMGRAPSPKHSIDRNENSGNYEPGNCKWATADDQANNKRSNVKITYKGKSQTLSQWCVDLNINYQVVQPRLKVYGWSVIDAFEIEPGKRKNGSVH